MKEKSSENDEEIIGKFQGGFVDPFTPDCLEYNIRVIRTIVTINNIVW